METDAEGDPDLTAWREAIRKAWVSLIRCPEDDELPEAESPGSYNQSPRT